MQKQQPVLLFQVLLFLLAGFASAFRSSLTPRGAALLTVSLSANADSSMAESKPQESTTPSNETTCDNGDMLFGRFVIPKASIFCKSRRAAAFVNLRPIVPGHVLVIPHKVVPHMDDLEEDDYLDLWKMVRQVQTVLQKAYPKTTAFNVAVQDGKAAGQSVPHVHVHILPRSGGDFERNDDVYDSLEAWAPTEAMAASKEKTDIEVPDDADRIDRTPQAMADEAALYRGFFEETE